MLENKKIKWHKKVGEPPSSEALPLAVPFWVVIYTGIVTITRMLGEYKKIKDTVRYL